VRGDAVFQLKKRSQPIQPLIAKAFDVGPGVRPSDRAAEGDDDHLEQVVHACPLDARIGQIFKRCKNCNEPIGHGKTLRE
jgi:hypothetical protein